MIGDRAVAVIGAYGGVGTAAVRQLGEWELGPLRVGGHDLGRARALADGLPGVDCEAVAVDANDPASLVAFCEGCRLVVNCAGPSFRIGDGIAVAALAAGADYIDAGGEEPVQILLSRPGVLPPDRIALLSAGMVPGLSALLVRSLVGRARGPCRLTAYAGGLGRFTPGAAADYLARLSSGSGTPLAAWREGARRESALLPLRDVELPFFPRQVTGQPYLSTELERVARSSALEELSWYTVFDGEHVLRALRREPGSGGDPSIDAAAHALTRAAGLDAFGRKPYQRFVLRLDAGDEPSCTLVLRAHDPIALTGAAVALVARAALAGEVPPGLGFAGEVLDPDVSLERLREATAVEGVDLLEIPRELERAPSEEGTL
ncbi:MAG TPA: saccharopine dehydrogenase NADP-binding domain-containing protein [Solirubrobacteraceae bacterium]|jgi:hypothetical protein|nr:saccharopine dehydrogenase NADP-binding domain-containing protein [Solirubrobacteraceae bacterium]